MSSNYYTRVLISRIQCWKMKKNLKNIPHDIKITSDKKATKIYLKRWTSCIYCYIIQIFHNEEWRNEIISCCSRIPKIDQYIYVLSVCGFSNQDSKNVYWPRCEYDFNFTGSTLINYWILYSLKMKYYNYMLKSIL